MSIFEGPIIEALDGFPVVVFYIRDKRFTAVADDAFMGEYSIIIQTWAEYYLSAICSWPFSSASLLKLFHIASVSGAISSPSRYEAALQQQQQY